MATEVAAGRGEVWDRLVDPEELARWHPGADASPRVEGDWPAPGSRLHLFTAVRELPVELRQTVAELETGRSLRCRVRLGLYAFEGIWTLTAEGPARTRVGLRIVTQSEVPLVGGALDRFAVRRLAQEMAAAWLDALRDHCEKDAHDPAASRPPRASVSR